MDNDATIRQSSHQVGIIRRKRFEPRPVMPRPDNLVPLDIDLTNVARFDLGNELREGDIGLVVAGGTAAIHQLEQRDNEQRDDRPQG
jgi:hypothetical protein